MKFYLYKCATLKSVVIWTIRPRIVFTARKSFSFHLHTSGRGHVGRRSSSEISRGSWVLLYHDDKCFLVIIIAFLKRRHASNLITRKYAPVASRRGAARHASSSGLWNFTKWTTTVNDTRSVARWSLVRWSEDSPRDSTRFDARRRDAVTLYRSRWIMPRRQIRL